MSGELKCTGSQAMLLAAVGVRRQKPSGSYIPVRHLMNPLSACLSIDQIDC